LALALINTKWVKIAIISYGAKCWSWNKYLYFFKEIKTKHLIIFVIQYLFWLLKNTKTNYPITRLIDRLSARWVSISVETFRW